MNRTTTAAFPLLCFAALFSASPVYAQNVVVYSPEVYPTAQGHYLTLPPAYQPVPASQIQPQLALPVSVNQNQYQPALSQYRPTPVQQPTTFEQLPSFPDDHNLDPRYVPKPPVREPVAANQISLATRTGGEVGLQISSYRYQEHDVPDSTFALETGPNFGATLDGNKAYSDGLFISGNARIAYGQNDYTGSGTQSDLPDWLFEMRGLVGGDFVFENAFWHTVSFDLSPYLGLGFRYLYNDARGTTSTGAPGYERYSHYFYLPVGITPRFRVTDTTRVSLNLEYDQLLYGWQVSSLGDATPGDSDLTNSQNSGYGLRGSVMYEWPSWSIGPFFYYWNINQSDTACSALSCGDEPHNQTIEYGIQGRYKF